MIKFSVRKGPLSACAMESGLAEKSCRETV